MEAGCVASARNLLRWAFADWANGGHRLCTRFEFKSKAIVHFGQDKALIASASLADNGAMHTVAINTLTVFDVVHANQALSLRSRFRLGGCRNPEWGLMEYVVCEPRRPGVKTRTLNDPGPLSAAPPPRCRLLALSGQIGPAK